MVAFASRDPFDPPGKPSIPCVVNFGNDFCDIEYKVPVTDGGSPIFSYTIEKRSSFWTGWEKVVDMGKPLLKCHIPDLIEGDKVSFRVKALNMAGFGDPSDASDPVTIRPRR